MEINNKEVQKAVNEFKNKKHSGFVFMNGENIYLFDEIDKIIYSIKSKKTLKWQWSSKINQEKYPMNCFVILHDGHGKRTKIWLRELLQLKEELQ